MVLAYKELHAMARPDCLYFSSTVCGGLPVVNVGRRDISCTGADFEHVRGVFNSTSNYILKQMGEGGSFDDALATAQVSPTCIINYLELCGYFRNLELPRRILPRTSMGTHM